MLAVEGLSFHYGKRAILFDIDLTMVPGEIVCLIGPNGAGKSTLLKCVNRILSASGGRIILGGKPVEAYSRRELARRVAYVPQHAGSAMSLKVIEMVDLGREPHRGLSSIAHDRAVSWDAIEQLGLSPLAFRLFGELSGGERQRVLIARALAQEGELILMDEPTSNLDLYYQLETMSAIKAIAGKRRVAALVAMHDLSMAARLSDRLVLISGGRVHVAGAWRDVLTKSNLESTYGVSAIVGVDGGWPYVIPTHRQPAPGPTARSEDRG